MQTEIRPLAEDDLDRVCELEESSFSMPWKKEDFKHLIEDSNSVYLVILADGYIVGCAGYTFNGYEGYINNVVIDSEYRNRGLAALLLKRVLQYGSEAGVTEYTLEVRVSNEPAIRLYEGLGFKSEGIRKRLYEHPVEDAHVMWLRGN